MIMIGSNSRGVVPWKNSASKMTSRPTNRPGEMNSVQKTEKANDLSAIVVATDLIAPQIAANDVLAPTIAVAAVVVQLVVVEMASVDAVGEAAAVVAVVAVVVDVRAADVEEAIDVNRSSHPTGCL
jgi:hypothetical protein